MLDKFADELRLQRENSGLTLQQLANKTRIDLKFLEAIDQGKFAFLPDIYVKAFLKQYAKTIGLDENITIKKFEAAKENREFNLNPSVEEVKAVEPIKEPVTQAPKIETPIVEVQKSVVKPVSQLKSYADEPKHKSAEDEQKANKQLMMFGLGGVGLIIIAALLYLFIFDKSDKIVVEETPIDEAIEQNNQRYVEEQPAEQIIVDSTDTIVSSDSLHLTFYAKETAWVFVVLDNNRTQEFTLNANSKFTINALSEFKATVGNSGGVTLQMNNQDVDFIGRSGSVRHFKLDKNGLIYLNAPPKIEQQ